MFRELDLPTPRGVIKVREYGPAGLESSVLMVGGVGGGFDSPARGLYEKLGDELPTHGIGGLWVRYRNPRVLAECVEDVVTAMQHLVSHGCRHVALVGHSLGGAVAVNAALQRRNETACVVTLATQLSGLDELPALKRPLLLVHGTNDDVLPAACSVTAFRMAREPRRLELIDGAGHTLDEDADRVLRLVRRWLLEQLHPTDLLQEAPVARLVRAR